MLGARANWCWASCACRSSRSLHIEGRSKPNANWRRRVLIALGFGFALGSGVAAPPADFLGRLSIDLLLPLRHYFYGPLFASDESAVAAIVIDEETYKTPPFSDTPKVAWTPHLADIISAVAAGGAKVIGLDLVYPTSLDRKGLLRGYDLPLLKALVKTGRQGKLVLGELRLSQQPVSPYRGQIAAVGGPRNVRLLNFLLDVDEVIRRYPRGFATENGATVPSFGVELAQRAGARPPIDDFVINFNTAPNPIPIYSFADIWACARAGQGDYFAEHFGGKVVLIGASLDVEDRAIPARRFVRNRFDSFDQPRCVIKAQKSRFGKIVERRSIPGVFTHAAAINTLVKDVPLVPLDRTGTFFLASLSVAAMVLIFFVLPPVMGLLAGAGVTIAQGFVALGAFAGGVVIPLVSLALAAVASYTFAYAYRFVVEDKAKRQIKHAFRHFLAPELVEELAENPAALALGGESKIVTVFFSDIAGFTTISEAMSDRPETLVDILNQYLTVMTTEIERNGGYVDKFIGDAVMAVWGAPLDDDEAERHAVDAALDCFAALDRFNTDVVTAKFGLAEIGTRIGINTGPAVVGNMGSATRLNYTITGDIVNLAARLEGANKIFGTSIMIGETTARGLRESHVLRRLDRLIVKGKTVPVKVFEVIGRHGEVPANDMALADDFHRALGLYYRRRFTAARDAFRAMAGDDPTAKLYMDRCEYYIDTPPPAPWDRTFAMSSK